MDWAERIGRRIRFRDLHVLLAVAEHGSMSKASAELAISHPVVSKTISDLERTLGVRLFDRGSQGVELTDYGRALLECGVSVFDEMRRGLKRIEFLTDPNSGELRVGCPEITMAGLMPAIAERFSRRYPGIRLHVVLANTAMLQFQDLRERKVDLLIGRLPQQLAEDDLSAEILFDEPFVVVAGTQGQWARRRQVRIEELVGEPWILPPYDSAPGSAIAEVFHACRVQPPQPSIVTLSVQLTVTLVAGGRFLGMLPSSVAQFNAKRVGLKVVPLKLPPTRLAAGIITVKGRTLNPLVELFIACARETGSSISAAAPVRS
jgi:DNA-binding transcriptional LysR family regulator